MMDIAIERLYRKADFSLTRREEIIQKIKDVVPNLSNEKLYVDSEICYNIGVKQGKLVESKRKILNWILAQTFGDRHVSFHSLISEDEKMQGKSKCLLVEIGPRLNFSTAWSTNAVSVCNAVGLDCVVRIEISVRYLIKMPSIYKNISKFTKEDEHAIVRALHDPMTECRYNNPLNNFNIDVTPEQCYEIDVLRDGKMALQKANASLGLSFDDRDVEFYVQLFKEQLKRNPTNVECFDLAQSNSEHSRHWFFRGNIVIDNENMPNTLMNLVMSTQNFSNANSVIKFCDNSSAIKGFVIKTLVPGNPTEPSCFLMNGERLRHITLTAETHNFPTGVAPFPGATTGTGGRIRDNHATGRGAHVVAGTAGYCFGNLNIPGYNLPWEEEYEYPKNFASPVSIAIEASNGASDYGNKFGEPVVAGFARSFGMKLANNERREWIKPIMFSGGLGSIEDEHIRKGVPEKGMEVVKIGGPVYRIGVGGGSASSVEVQGDNSLDIDFGAVQRGDAEMEQKLNRIIRACIEMGRNNPICSIHDQGAGGNGNVLKEITEPAGAVIQSRAFKLGDPTISTLELWGAEYQESDAILIRSEKIPLLKKISEREKVPICFVGKITGDGKIVLDDSKLQTDMINQSNVQPSKKLKKQYPVDLPLEVVLGKIPPKTFCLQRVKTTLLPLELPNDLTVIEALNRVLRLPSVASKRYLTNKVDRCVTGLIAQQQCVGPLHTPVSDVAVTALSLFNTVGAATAIGEQPIKSLIDPACGARMTVGEALTNLVFAEISDIKDVKCSGNWMYAAKLPGEGARLYDACQALCTVLSELGVAIDGGKDSLSMAARVGNEVVKSPGNLVLSVYGPCPDITKTVTPDLKLAEGENALLHVKLSNSLNRTGGSALAQVFGQIGDQTPDMDDVKLFTNGFLTTQKLIKDGMIRSGHDISDGGIITTLLEMAFSGNRGISVDFEVPNYVAYDNTDIIKLLFAEELGIVIEVAKKDLSLVSKLYADSLVQCCYIGRTTEMGCQADISIAVNGNSVLQEKMSVLRDIWEETSFRLEKLQANKDCVQQELDGMSHRKSPTYKINFSPKEGLVGQQHGIVQNQKPRVAVIREEGSNGDREMVASLFLAGFDVWDVTMQDICNGAMTLNMFRGVVFVGGFSYADVFGSAKGWAAVARFNEAARKEFEQFRLRKDTFSLGVCNGCQLMALLGWVGGEDVESALAPEQMCCFTNNDSGRFESRFPTVKIEKSPAIMLRDMEDSVLGIWVAHGEGKVIFRSETVKQRLIDSSLAPIRYVDEDGNVTTQYPFNPNGSPDGIAALCSKDGRHLAMMPHPERCSLLWQWPWMPENWKTLQASPWLQLFHNAYEWCLQ